MVYGFASVALMVLELQRMQEHLSGWINATALVDAAAAVFSHPPHPFLTTGIQAHGISALLTLAD